jgi:putative N-acetylmannosamine-6-phosphate epimerase
MSPIETKLQDMDIKITALNKNIKQAEKAFLRSEVVALDKMDKMRKTKEQIGHLQQSMDNSLFIK